MKKVIGGKMYNTETAEELFSFDNGLGGGDFRAMEETLYVTKKGTYFLAGSGGPMSKYSEPCGNMTSGGSGFSVLTKFEALEWLESHDAIGVIEAFFAEDIEDA